MLGRHPDVQCASSVERADSAEAAGALPSKRGEVFQKAKRQLEMEGQSRLVHHQVGGVQGRIVLDEDLIMLGRVQNQHIWLWHPQTFPAGQGDAHLMAWLADFHLALKSLCLFRPPQLCFQERGKVLGLFISSFS